MQNNNLRRELKNNLKRLTVLISIGVGVVIMFYLETGCLIQRIIKIPCPTCGMTRALFALISGDFIKSFEYHPMLLSVPILVTIFLFSDKLFSGKFKIPSTVVLVVILLGFGLNYIYNLILYF